MVMFSFIEGIIDVVLPLAKEYQVNSLLQKCEDWLLTEIEFIVGEVIGHVKETQTKVEFLAKCLLYATKNELDILYHRAFELLVPYNLIRYQNTKFYKFLPDNVKWQLLEARLVKIERTQFIGDGSFPKEKTDDATKDDNQKKKESRDIKISVIHEAQIHTPPQEQTHYSKPHRTKLDYREVIDKNF